MTPERESIRDRAIAVIKRIQDEADQRRKEAEEKDE